MSPLNLPKQGQAYALVVGVSLAILLVGLAIPLTFGERAGSTSPDRVTRNEGPGLPGEGSGPSQEDAGLQEDMDGPADPQGEASPAAPGASSSGPGSEGDAAGLPGSAPGGPSNGEGDGGGSAALGPSDVGVTAETIKVGILTVDITALSEFGVVDEEDAENSVEEQKRTWKAYINELNSRGGIRGREVVPVFASYTAGSGGGGTRQACLRLVRDEKVFAVLGFFYGPDILCITEEHGVPLIMSVGTYDEYYERSNGLLMSTDQSLQRAANNRVAELHRMGLLEEKKIGVFGTTYAGDEKAVTDSTVRTLTEFGYSITHRSKVDYPSSSSQQIPVEVSEMKRKGVNVVLDHSNTILFAEFVHQADGQMFFPTYYQSDWAQGSANYFPEPANSPSIEGMLAVGVGIRNGEGRVGEPEAPADARCREIYENQTGEQVERDSDGYWSILQICQNLVSFELAAHKDGPELTRTGMMQGFEGLEFDNPYHAAGRYAPGRYDPVDFVRSLSWENGCACYKPVSDFRRAEF